MVSRGILLNKKEERPIFRGSRPKKPPRGLDPDELDDAVVLNEKNDGFIADVAVGDELLCTRWGHDKTLSVVKTITGSDGEAMVDCWDLTTNQFFSFTPNSAMTHTDYITIKKMPQSKKGG